MWWWGWCCESSTRLLLIQGRRTRTSSASDRHFRKVFLLRLPDSPLFLQEGFMFLFVSSAYHRMWSRLEGDEEDVREEEEEEYVDDPLDKDDVDEKEWKEGILKSASSSWFPRAPFTHAKTSSHHEDSPLFSLSTPPVHLFMQTQASRQDASSSSYFQHVYSVLELQSAGSTSGVEGERESKDRRWCVSRPGDDQHRILTQDLMKREWERESSGVTFECQVGHAISLHFTPITLSDVFTIALFLPLKWFRMIIWTRHLFLGSIWRDLTFSHSHFSRGWEKRLILKPEDKLRSKYETRRGSCGEEEKRSSSRNWQRHPSS